MQVFPRAKHTRFEHSLGVGHLARRWGERLSKQLDPAHLGDLSVQDCVATETDLLRLELAGYAHDLGHGALLLSPCSKDATYRSQEAARADCLAHPMT